MLHLVDSSFSDCFEACLLPNSCESNSIDYPESFRSCTIQTSELQDNKKKTHEDFMIILRSTRCNFTIVLHVRANWRTRLRLTLNKRDVMRRDLGDGNRGLREQCCVIILTRRIRILRYTDTCRKLKLKYRPTIIKSPFR